MVDRFVNSNSEHVEMFIRNSKNENTSRSTNSWVNQFAAWAKWKGKQETLETYTPDELDETLCLFYAEVKKNDGYK